MLFCDKLQSKNVSGIAFENLGHKLSESLMIDILVFFIFLLLFVLGFSGLVASMILTMIVFTCVGYTNLIFIKIARRIWEAVIGLKLCIHSVCLGQKLTKSVLKQNFFSLSVVNDSLQFLE